MMTNSTSDDKAIAGSATAPRLLDLVRDRLRLKHYSIRTEQAYLGWIKRFILFHGKRHPAQMGKAEVEAFLTALAVERNVAAATQGQALAAILFLYQQVLDLPLPWLDEVTRAKRPARLPTVLSTQEVGALLAAVDDPELALVARLLYGTGMRLMEAVRLRVKDVDLARSEITVREGKGNKDAAKPGRTPARQDRSSPAAAPAGPRRRARHGLSAARAGGKIPGGSDRLRLAVRLCRAGFFDRPALRNRAAPSSRRAARAACDQAGGGSGGNRQAGHAAYLAPFVRDAPARIGAGHPHRAGTAGPQGREHDDDLHARAQSRRVFVWACARRSTGCSVRPLAPCASSARGLFADLGAADR